MDVYPNPASSNNFTINFKGIDTKEEVLIVVYDVMGREQFAKIVIGNNQLFINSTDIGNQLVPGIYYIVASNKEIFERKKFIIR